MAGPQASGFIPFETNSTSCSGWSHCIYAFKLTVSTSISATQR